MRRDGNEGLVETKDRLRNIDRNKPTWEHHDKDCAGGEKVASRQACNKLGRNKRDPFRY
jgi:hypothetical protein